MSMLPIAIVLLSLAQQGAFRREFPVAKESLRPTGRSDYIVLEPGYHLMLEGKENGKRVRLAIEVLDRTQTVDGVETRVVREHESVAGNVVEISMNYFAFDPVTKDIYYFGESVDIYRKGKVVNHEGAWLSGVNGAHFGLAMPGKPSVGDRYYQEIAPGVAMDRAENVSLSASLVTKAGKFSKCLRIQETTPLEPDAKEYKVYARGVGLIADGPLRLTNYGKPLPR